MRFSKLYQLLIILLLSIPFNSLYPQWEIQETGIKSRITNIYFLDSLNGWAVTDTTFFLHTTDGGMDWTKENLSEDVYGLMQIQFISKDIGYACGSLGQLLSTKDGGKTWVLYPYAFDIDFWDIFFVNETEGWAVGERYGNNFGRGMIVHTSSGGAEWNKQVEIETANQFEAKFFKAIRMKNDKVGWAIAGDYFDNFSPTYVYKTENGGENWTILNSPIQRPARRLKLINKDTLWVDGYGVAQMSISVDAGDSWELIQNGGKYISAISPLSGNKGWICSVDIRGNDPSLILYTSDGGISWVEELQLDGQLLDIENKGDYVWIAGTDGLMMRKKINVTAIKDNDYVYNSFELFQNYPNPFNSQTTITYTLPEEAYVRIEICNSLGEVVSSVNLFSQQMGEHGFTWNARNKLGNTVSTGAYFYRISTSYKNAIMREKTSKMLLVK
jgi:photosystem II stability/assembly factor-like uncharacterized protein